MTVLLLFIYKSTQNSLSALEKCVGAPGLSAAEGCVQIPSYEMSVIIRKDQTCLFLQPEKVPSEGLRWNFEQGRAVKNLVFLYSGIGRIRGKYQMKM